MNIPSEHPASAAGAEDEPAEEGTVCEDRHWCRDGWTARVVESQDGDGWAVSMSQDGEHEPVLVCPWTMGRDKKNPKPLDQAAFLALVKSATEVLQRQQQQLRARLHKQIHVAGEDGEVTVTLDIVPDEYEPHALLRAHDADGGEIARTRVAADFSLSNTSARAWVAAGFRLSAQAFF
ncbi:hypothetical protein [Pseudothauera nasutitermitis]|nr:hypothetical protein [Pseudothauera nasutitermitis]